MRKARADLDLNDLRARIIRHKEEGAKIISHFNKMQEYYDEWQDRLNTIQEEINSAERDYGIPPKEIQEYTLLDNILGGN